MAIIEGAKSRGERLNAYTVADLGADQDLAAQVVFVAPAGGCTLTKIGIVPVSNWVGVDNSNTSVWTITDAAGNQIVTKTYNATTVPPSANTYDDLGTLDSTHKVLTANEVVRLAITNGTTANLSACQLVIEWEPD